MTSKTTQIRRVIVAAALIGLAGPPARETRAQGVVATFRPTPRALEVSPAGPPAEALRYRFLPLVSERTPGDAAPIYLRATTRAEMGKEATQILQEGRPKWEEWLALPMDEFPAAEARTMVNHFASRLEQFGFAARRRTCDWNYTLPEQRENAIEILLPDAQDLRNWGFLLALKARVEIAEGKTSEAVRTIETGLALGRHMSEAPFLINALVGMAIARQMLDRVEDLIARPGMPNLYWALTALPRPFIPVRPAMEHEQKLFEWMVPGLEDTDRPRTLAEWTAMLERFYDKLSSLDALLSQEQGKGDPLPDFDTFRAEALRRARADEAFANQAPSERAILLYLASRYRAVRDETFKLGYLPYAEAVPFHEERERAGKAAAEGDSFLQIFVKFQPALRTAHRAEAQLDRRIAALRAVEALRMARAQLGGKWPATLDEVKAVPVPLDPVTGRAFDYRVEDAAAVLSTPDHQPQPGSATYRLTARP